MCSSLVDEATAKSLEAARSSFVDMLNYLERDAAGGKDAHFVLFERDDAATHLATFLASFVLDGAPEDFIAACKGLRFWERAA